MLAKGNKGQEVKEHQDDVIALGFGEYLGDFGADRHFGDLTEEATRSLQKWLGIKVDGIVGSQTKSAVDQAKKQAGLKGTNNFNIDEFRCSDNGEMLKSGMDSELVLNLEVLRYELGNKPVTINSGYRTPSYNKVVGGAANSQHLYGKATDIVVDDVRPGIVQKHANDLFANGGLGHYNTFTHVDTRGYRARW